VALCLSPVGGHATRLLQSESPGAAVVALGVLGLGMPHWAEVIPPEGLDDEAATAQTTLAASAGGVITLTVPAADGFVGRAGSRAGPVDRGLC
jgi:hypothetical protein